MKDLSLHILDIIQNSLRADASLIELTIEENLRLNILKICIADNGKGMDAEMIKKATDPYFTTRKTRKVGLGLSLFKQNAEQTGGYLTINSVLNQGTEINAIFGYNNIDRPALGDVPGIVALSASSNPAVDFVYKHLKNGKEYLFDTREVKAVLEDVSISNSGIMRYIKEMIYENLANIGVSFS